MKKLFFTALMLGAFTFGYSQSGYYNDYRRSITDVNWQTVAAELLLTPQQKDQLFGLNSRYKDYNSFNRVYASNPERWRTTRYNEMERIMGSAKYAEFKNKYYKGQNPVAVYNRNKNNNTRYNHVAKKARVYQSNKAKGKTSHGNRGKGKAKHK
jgi:hypothetical protein